MTDKKALEVLKSWLQLAYQNADGTDECCAELYEALQTMFALINRQQAEIERLNKKVEELSDVLSDTIRIRYAEAKTEAYKEFAERLKNKIKTECNPYGKPTFDYDTSIAIMRYIDNLVKEMESENNG